MGNCKKLFKLLLIFSMIFTLAACNTVEEKTPTDVVEDFFEKYKSGDAKTIGNLLGAVDKGDLDQADLEQAFKEMPQSSLKLLQVIKKTNYKINSENINEDNATVNVTVKGIDVKNVFKEFIGKTFTNLFKDAMSGKEDDEDRIKKQQDELLKKVLEETEFTERTGDISLQKINNEWVITNDEKLLEILFNIDRDTIENFSELEDKFNK